MKKYLIITFFLLVTNAVFSQQYQVYKTEFYNSNGNLISSTIRNTNGYYINIIDDDEVSITTNGTDVVYYRLGLAIESEEGKIFYMENSNHKWFIIVFTNDYIKITSTKETNPVTIKHYFTH